MAMPNDQIRYDLLVQEALRSVVRRVLTDAARLGLPGEHHFNISFRTHDEGVSIPNVLTSRYPDEMAIILQHEFWDLTVLDDRFEVSLNFSRKPERLIIPFSAITGFSDPSVPFGFKIESQSALSTKEAEPAPQRESSKALAQAKTEAAVPLKLEKRPAQESAATKTAEPAPMATESEGQKSKVVSIDAFRKK
jgi:uncharacterized protein